ncbi:IS3 family transposase [Cytobacillus depressus]|uniref:IS3 family transposase n=1 Tax=Cytobacillus depressus TaxID=1602942 RepID=UPI003CCD3223
MIIEMKQTYPITWLTEIAEVKRSSYYKWVKTIALREKRMKQDQDLMEKMLSVHNQHKEFGYPRMVIALREKGFIVNHKKVYRLMKLMGIQSVIRKKWRYFGKKGSKVYPNLVNREFKNRKKNEVLVSDITYIPFQNKFYYLSVVQDLYNNEIVSWKVSDRNNLKLVLDTIEDLNKKRNVYGTILHSDQGFQYTSKKYNKRLNKYGIRGSHSRKGNCLDNACIESFFSHFKTEMLYQYDFRTEEELIQAIETYMYHYNYKRFQKRLNHRAPVEYRITMAA